MEASPISFSFGENWQSYLQTIGNNELQKAQNNIREWLGPNKVANQSVLDIGCGSGVHSYNFFKLGAARVISFDYDLKSVEATRILWEKAGKPDNWKIFHGSVLDSSFIEELKREHHGFDIVYSWGVLHHTGDMWNALKNAISLLKDKNSLLWIALYKKTWAYPRELRLKQKYNSASYWIKKWMIRKEIFKFMWNRFKKRQNPFKWNQIDERGMNVFHDIIDWLGGLPYEVATTGEVVLFCQNYGLKLIKIEDFQHANNIYLFEKKS